jgi:hypothetical protein
MALSTGLPVSRLVSVQVALENQAAPVPAINTLMLLGTSDVIDVNERLREYANLNEVAIDFGVYAEEYTAADSWFSQVPRPDNLLIGRWAREDTGGILYCGVLSASEQMMSTPIPTSAPVNVDIPHLYGNPSVGGELTVTSGNWTGDPSVYAYQWKSDANNIGTNAPNYVVVDADVGHSVTCVVTASNILGQTAAPPSNSLMITSARSSSQQGASPRVTPLPPGTPPILGWRGVTDGSFRISVDGGGPYDIVGLDLKDCTNLNGVASVIDPAMSSVGCPCSVIWSGSQFIFRSSATGVQVDISFLSPTGSGTDISAKLRGTASTGASGVVGIAAETCLAAVVKLDDLFSSRWYGLFVPAAMTEDSMQLAAYCEGSDPPHYYACTVADPAVLDRRSDQDLAYQLKNFGYNRTAAQYSSTAWWAAISYMSRILTTQWGGVRTTITQMYKREPGVPPERLSTNQANIVMEKNCNVYVAYANETELIQYGTSASGEYTDTIVGADALAAAVQTALFNVLYTTAFKIPQTDVGMAMLTNACVAACTDFVNNGYLAPGTWNAPAVGGLNTGDLVTLGFYVFAPSMVLQSEADRAARRAPLITIAAKLAGAIHTVDCLIVVNA